MSTFFHNAPPDIFLNPNYIHHVVQYNGDLEKEAQNKPNYYITIINKKYAIISSPIKDPVGAYLSLEDKDFSSISYISRYNIYTLQDLSPIIAADINLIQIQPPLYLTGAGVVVGILDTGIDYLNKEFMNEDGTTRITTIWDQTIVPKTPDNRVPFGQVFLRDDINNAIKAFNEGKDPYEIVPSRDTVGHGTSMAGVVGAKGLNQEVRGAAPQCEYVIIKLYEAEYVKNFYSGTIVYDRAALMIGINFLYEYTLAINTPMVMLLPIGTTFGNHRGDGILEEYINNISNNTGIVIVTGSGNQGDSYGHTSGKITSNNGYEDVPFIIDEKQKYLSMEVWVDKPNSMSIEVISASGESSGIIPVYLRDIKVNKYIFEDTIAAVQYFFPDELTGDELISIRFFYLTPGVWKLRLHKNYVIDGAYNVWMLQRGLAIGDTSFIYPDPYGTFTGPGSADYIITVANYNQNNFNIVPSSGLSFLDNFYNAVDIAAGGVNVQTPSISGKTTVISGTSVSAAVVAGACAILLEWGIVKGNDQYMYSQKIKTYLLRGTEKRVSDTYPNAEWGYGVLNLFGVFKYLE